MVDSPVLEAGASGVRVRVPPPAEFPNTSVLSKTHLMGWSHCALHNTRFGLAVHNT